MKVINYCLAALLAVVAFDAAAITLYKSTDEDGRVTYSDQPSRSLRERVVPLDIDTTADQTQLPLPAQSSESTRDSENERIIRRRPVVSDDSAVRLAREGLDAARSALEDAQNNSTDEDWIYFDRRMKPPGSRGPRPEYLARLESLEAQVKAAEITLADAVRVFQLRP